MTKTEQLDELFDKWEKYHNNGIGFKRDGIIDEFEFEKKDNPKILFIAKEPNDPKQSEGDFRDWWKKEVKFTFSHRLSEWAYGCIENFPEYNKISDNYELKMKYLSKIAFMNLKKSGGGGTANDEKIYEVLADKKEYDFIHQEIDIIDPEIIITCLGAATNHWAELFGDISVSSSNYDLKIGRFENKKVIDYYHPSNRFPRAMSYSLLQNLFSSLKLL